MRRKLAAIWRILACKNYLLVIEEDSRGGTDILFDFTMPRSDVKMAAAALFDIIDEQDKLHHHQDQTLRAFKEMLH